jgi:autophagy-related protein 2
MDKHHSPQLPDFSILDWTQAHLNSTKFSTWRTKTKPNTSKRRDSQTRVGVGIGLPLSPGSPTLNFGSEEPQTAHSPAVTANARFASSPEKGQASARSVDDYADVDVAPLHIFIDLGLALGSDHMLVFLDDAISGYSSVSTSSRNDGEGSDPEEEDSNTLPVPPEKHRKKVRETERQRLERLVLEDLDLDLDYRDNQLGPEEPSSVPRVPHTGKVGPNLLFAILLLEIQHFAYSPADLERNNG